MMRDIEIVLRFFALRHAAHYQRGMKGFLDLYMIRARGFDTADIDFLETLFSRTIELGTAIYGDALFRPWNLDKESCGSAPQIAFADAVMVGL